MNITKYLKSDAISGFLVFLIALPLCLGIAKASGFPPIAGIYSAVMGGLLVTFLSDSQLTIKGPAAGLIVIAIGAVQELGGPNDPTHAKGYALTLAIVVIAGFVQILLGLIKAGKLGDFFPSSVIHGMLAAIGIIIMSKQLHLVMGVVPDGKEPFELIKEIPESIEKMNIEVAIIGFVSLLVLFLFPLIKNRIIKRIPAPLVVLAIAIPLGFYFDLSHEHDYDLGSLHFHIDPSQMLVALPDNFFKGITYPDFSQITSATSIKYIIMFALVGSIESLLSAKAIDTMDPQHRKTNFNRDLMAVGLGNSLVGLIGGLPMISEIVRSSANINNGGKTKMSNFFHGLFLFLFALLAASLIQKIPTAALSAMLVYTGFKLAAPVEFKKVQNVGYDQLLLFITTLVVTIMTDLLIGVAVGIVLKILLHLMQGVSFKELLAFNWDIQKEGDSEVIKLKGATSFMNYLKFKSFIDNEPKDKKITLDFSKVKLADHTFLENLHHLQNDFMREGGQLTLTGFNKHHFQSNHPLAARKTLVNPQVKRVDMQLNKRQKLFQEIAPQYKLDFEPVIISAMIKPYLAPFSILSRFHRAQNMMISTESNFSLLMFDIIYDKIGDFKKDRLTGTYAIIDNIDSDTLPEFYLEPTSLVKKLKSRYHFRSIILDSKPSFNLYGDDKNELENFFTPALVDFISKQNYTIESKRHSILIHRDNEKINREKSIRLFIEFTKELADKIIAKEKK